jgi:hypothetical protein
VIAARRRRNFQVGDWHFAPSIDRGLLVETVLAWCREVAGSCKRPFGIDNFDLAVALSGSPERPARSFSLKCLRPVSFYSDEVRNLLSELVHAEAAGTSPVYVSAALFSWGEAAHAALPERLTP